MTFSGPPGSMPRCRSIALSRSSVESSSARTGSDRATRRGRPRGRSRGGYSCPSGRLAYELPDGSVEPDLPTGIAVTKDGPYWVTGSVEVVRADGKPFERRHRVELCRCGQSAKKPLCDGAHRVCKFTD